MTQVQWVDAAIKLLTSGAFVTLVLGFAGIVIFRNPLGELLQKLTKLGIFGDKFQAEFGQKVSVLEREAAEIATPDNRKAIEEMIRTASLIGYNMRADGVTEPPTWEIDWKDGTPQIAISVDTIGPALAAIDRRRRNRSSAEEFWARKLWGSQNQHETRHSNDAPPP